ncbi:hypothetical protein [Brevundimonas sp.]|uniref:hypothetical protein n=1 Tax=Brevundimonas sp. TaxID=1871086 RepID=UPI0028A0B181|nr:hypothetical protein [Brevundimonas sp.]
MDEYTGLAKWGLLWVLAGAVLRGGLGLVTDMYYLQLGFDPETVGVVNLGMGEGKPFRKYHRHRTRLMFSPFETFRARRVWGAESPIELFLLHGLHRRETGRDRPKAR